MSEKPADVVVIFSPLIEGIPIPPAGIPSLVSYLKDKGMVPHVLDLDMAYKKTNKVYRALCKIEKYLVSCKPGNSGKVLAHKAAAQQQNAVDAGVRQMLRSIVRGNQFLKNAGRRLLLILRRTKNGLFKQPPMTLDQILTKFEDNHRYDEVFESMLWPVIEASPKAVIGISAIYPDQLMCSLIVARLIKKINPQAFVLLGGSQVTAYLDTLIKASKMTPYIDALMVFEGEVGLTNLIKARHEGKPVTDIENLYYKDGDHYSPSTKVGFKMKLAEYHIPDYSGFDLKDYAEPALALRTLRGCFWNKCSFCSYPTTGGAFSMTGEDFVISCIKDLQQKHGTVRFEFIDPSLPAAYLNKIAQAILKEGLKVEWFSRANCQEEFANPEFARLLKQSGCLSLALGVESGTDRIIRLMRKQQKSKEAAIETIRVLREAGINVDIYGMIGFPTETVEEMEDTVDFIMMLKKKYQVGINWISIFNLVDGSPILQEPEKFGITKVYDQSVTAKQGYGYAYDVSEGATVEEAQAICKRGNFFLKYPFLYDLYRTIYPRRRSNNSGTAPQQPGPQASLQGV
jgi:radical SAM superfamily enzyme YgiQ (UPF0313 family)